MGELYRLEFVSGKSYIGITKDRACRRYLGHAKAARTGSQQAISNAWRKYGAPTLRVLAVLSTEDLLTTEKRAIRIFNTLVPNGYNITPGGDTPPMSVPSVAAKLVGRPRPLEVREAISAKHRGKILTLEHRAKLSIAQRKPENRARLAARNAAMKGRKLSAEHRAKISFGNKGKKRSEEQRLHMSLGRSGIYPSAETRAKLSAARKGKKLTNAHRISLSLSQKLSWMTGRRSRTFSDEHRARLSNALTLAWQRGAFTKRGAA